MDRPSGGPRPAQEAPGLLATPLDRRRFIVLLGAAAAYAAMGPRLASARRDDRGAGYLQPWTLPDDLPASPVDAARALIGAAVLAPSDWNTQPWRFEVDGSTIRIVADAKRALPVTDPDRRGMMVSLGAALENLLVAARAYGLRPAVSYLPHGGAAGVVAEVAWTNGEPRRDRALFAAIPDRRTNRRDYDGRAIFAQNRAQLAAQVPEGLFLHWLDDRDALRAVSDVVYEATHAQVMDARAEAERFAWMRFDDDARRRGDGIPSSALELAGPANWFAGRYFDPDSWFLRFGAEFAAKQARGQVRSAGAVALLAASRHDDAQWLMGGQAYERFALKATQLGIALQPLSAPISVERRRPDLLRVFRATGEEPLMLVRLGHARRPGPLPRRGVTVVASFRNT
jgi:nitroreductase